MVPIHHTINDRNDFSFVEIIVKMYESDLFRERLD